MIWKEENKMIGEGKLLEIAQKYGTPTYVFDLDQLEQRVKELENALAPNVKICYAMKANAFLINKLDELKLHFEVCSPGEFQICKLQKITMERVVFSGVNKQVEEVQDAIQSGVREFTCESVHQADVLQEAAETEHANINVILRLSGGNQFGMDKEAIYSVLQKKKQLANLTFIGVQCYNGTQHGEIGLIMEEFKQMKEFLNELNAMFDLHMRRIEYGSGLPVEYFEKKMFQQVYTDLSRFFEQVNYISKEYEVVLEIGRFLVATTGVYLTAVKDKKLTNGIHYAIMDGGINHLVYYGQVMAMKKPVLKRLGEVRDESNQTFTLCGSLCTVADVLVKGVQLGDLRIGDVLAFYNTGAYSVTEGIYLFLSRKLPAVVLYSEQNGDILKRTFVETYELNC